MITMKRILHPTDFSEPSEHALSYAIAMAEEFNAELHLLHVVEEVARAAYFDVLQVPPVADMLDDCIGEAKRIMDDMVSEENKAKVGKIECHVRTGVPFLEIVNCAEELQADMIVCGTHGRSGLKHVLFGSVAERIVRKAPCPVLSVRHPEHKFEMPTTKGKQES
jgi:nucleotide-binding universal stress UspA family protein